MRLNGALLPVIASLAVCPLLQAAAIYSTVGDSTFAIGGPRTVAIGSLSADYDIVGNSAAFAHASATGFGTFPAVLHVDVDGSADGPPDSEATSTAMSGHFFTLTNDGDSSIFVPFSFSYSWAVSVFADNPALEGATAGVFFAITGGGVEYEFNPTFSTTLGQTGGAGFDTIGGGFTVAPHSVTAFSVITDSSGFAHSAEVPEPGALTMCGLGAAILCLGYRRNARRRARAVL